MLKSIDPYREQVIETYKIHSEGYVSSQLDKLAQAQPLPLKDRLKLLTRLSELLKAHREDLALMASREMGKPLVQSRLEVEKCALVCDFYAKRSEAWLQDRPVEGVGQRASVSLQPLGTLLAIMPWNFPYWQVFRVLAPQIALGNRMVLKHASNVTGCGLLIEKLLLQAAGDHPVLSFLRLDRERALALVGDDRVQGVTLTGSSEAGQSVAEAAGRHLKKSVLELGGSDPYLVLRDADMKKTVAACVRGRTNNTGQSCIAAKRFIVVQDRLEEFLSEFTAAFARLRSGDPLETTTQMGPLAKKSLLVGLQEQLEDSRKDVEIFWEGEVPSSGYFFPPVVALVKNRTARIFKEETFGPLAAVLSVGSEEEAIEAANDSSYGLGGAVFTEDVEKGWQIARERLASGSCAVNTFVQSYPELPFGGTGISGYGRELSEIALWEFANVKSVVVR